MERQKPLEALAASRDPTGKKEPERSEILEALKRAVDGLPNELRLPVVLRFAGGMTQQEVATACGCRQTTISRRLEKAMGELKQTLVQAGFAGAIPLLASPESHFLEALTSEQPAVASTSRLLEIPKTAETLSRSARIAAPPTSTISTLWPALAAIAIVAAAGASLVLLDDPPNPADTKKAPETWAYEDDFDGDRVADFWEIVKPADQVRMKHKDFPSAMVLIARGPKVPKRVCNVATDHIEVYSRTFRVGQVPVEAIVEETRGHMISTGPLKSKDFKGTEINHGVALVDEACQSVSVRALTGNKEFAGRPDEPGDDPQIISTAGHYETNRIRLVLFPTGEALMVKNNIRAWGRFSEIPEALRIKISIKINRPDVFVHWPIQRVVVRTLEELPEELWQEWKFHQKLKLKNQG